jgi:hypothetical protein
MPGGPRIRARVLLEHNNPFHRWPATDIILMCVVGIAVPERAFLLE